MHSICTWICAGWQIFKVRGTFCQSSADLHKLFTYLSLLIFGNNNTFFIVFPNIYMFFVQSFFWNCKVLPCMVEKYGKHKNRRKLQLFLHLLILLLLHR